jgi:hypothetical protein
VMATCSVITLIALLVVLGTLRGIKREFQNIQELLEGHSPKGRGDA